MLVVQTGVSKHLQCEFTDFKHFLSPLPSSSSTQMQITTSSNVRCALLPPSAVEFKPQNKSHHECFLVMQSKEIQLTSALDVFS